MKIFTLLRPALVLVGILALLTGMIFPLAVTAIAQAAFPHQANGSLVRAGGKVVGSGLIGQGFSGPGFFHPRPSAAGTGYDAGNSSGTNLGPISDKLINGVADDPATRADETYAGIRQLAKAYRDVNGIPPGVLLPADAVTRSASGLDPHVSLRNAELQAERVARERGLPVRDVRRLIESEAEVPILGAVGEGSVNVLALNLRLQAKPTAY